MKNFNLDISYATISSIVWCYFPIRGSIIFLFFQHDPAMGTFFSNVIIMLMVALLIPSTYIPLLKHDLVFTRKRIDPENHSLTFKFIFLFVVWSSLSLLWTQATPITSAIFYTLSMISDLLLIFFIFKNTWSSDVAKASLRGFTLGSMFFAFVALTVAGISAGDRLGNESFLHPNAIGNSMALAIMACIYLISTERSFLFIFQLIIFVITLAACVSKTSIFALVFSLFISYILLGRYNLLSKIKIFSGFLLLTLPFFYYFYTKFLLYLSASNGLDAMTLSGRLIIWEQTWTKILDHFMIGHGILSFRDVGPQIISLRLVHPHNEILSIIFSLGIVGLLIVIAMYSSYAISVFKIKALDHKFFNFSLSLLLFSVFRGLTEASVVSVVFPIHFMLLICFWIRNMESSYENPTRT